MMLNEERFDTHWAAVTESGCWIWLADCNKKMGYGRFYVGPKSVRKLVLAHRFNYERFNGKIPQGLLCLHRCDVPCCVNPSHLFLGTHLDNSKDKIAKNRQNFPKWDKERRARAQHKFKITDKDVAQIKNDPRASALIAKDFKVHRHTITRIKSGKRRNTPTTNLNEGN